MPNEITEYIAKQVEAGYTPDQIKEALKKSGWNEVDILAALKDLQGPSQNPEEKSKVMLYLGIVVVGILVFASSAAGVWYFSDSSRGAVSVNIQQAENPSETQMVEMPEEDEEASESADSLYGAMETPTFSESTSSAQYQVSVLINELSDLEKVTPYIVQNLPSCDPISISFGEDPSNFEYSKNILGWVDDSCHYIEEMPNDYVTECFLPKEKLQSMVDEVSSAESGTFAISMSSDDTTTDSDSVWFSTMNDPEVCTLLVDGKPLEPGNTFCAEGVTCTETTVDEETN